MLAFGGLVQRTTVAFDAVAAASATPAQIEALQRQRLGRLLSSAQRTPRYRRVLQGRDPLNTRLVDLPVSDKMQLMQHFAEGVADPHITLAGVREFCADPSRVAAHFLGRYAIWESSGSTAMPGVFVQDEAALAVYDALEASRRVSPRPWARWFDPWGLNERFAFVGATGGHFATQVSLQRLRAANPWMAQHCRGFSILQPVAELVAELNAFAPNALATYPTAAVLLAEQAAAGALRFRPQELWTGGETLTAGMRLSIEAAFGRIVHNSYGASEFLPIAWECTQGRLHVNADWVILEPVDREHRPVPAGQLSHTTLLTNLANHVQPLIRFDIGDRTVLASERCPCGCTLPCVQVQGRCDDALVVPSMDGKPVRLLPLALTTLLEDEAGVFEFQLHQRGERHWQLLLAGDSAHAAGAQARCVGVLADFARAQGVAGLRIVTEAVESLPLGRSGKLQRVFALKPPQDPPRRRASRTQVA